MNTETLVEPTALPHEAAIPASKTLETCDAVIIALACKRFVVARQDRPMRIRSVQRLCQPLSQLAPGDRVYYQGRQVEVEAIEVY